MTKRLLKALEYPQADSLKLESKYKKCKSKIIYSLIFR